MDTTKKYNIIIEVNNTKGIKLYSFNNVTILEPLFDNTGLEFIDEDGIRCYFNKNYVIYFTCKETKEE